MNPGENEQKPNELVPPVENKSPLKALRTYQGDMEEIFSSNKASASSVVIAEQERKSVSLLEPEHQINARIRNKSFILIGGGLLLLGIITIGAVYYIKTQNKVVVEKQTKALIGFSSEKTLLVASSTREKIIKALSEDKKLFKLPVNSVLYVNTVNGNDLPESVENVLGLLAPRMPSSLLRALEKRYMFGVYSFDTNEPFIILKTDDFAASYAGMLKWEPNMIADLARLFTLPSSIVGKVNIFEDEELRNKDLRIIKDGSGKTVLLYSFIDKNTLVITSNESIFTGILGKYLISKTAR